MEKIESGLEDPHQYVDDQLLKSLYEFVDRVTTISQKQKEEDLPAGQIALGLRRLKEALIQKGFLHVAKNGDEIMGDTLIYFIEGSPIVVDEVTKEIAEELNRFLDHISGIIKKAPLIKILQKALNFDSGKRIKLTKRIIARSLAEYKKYQGYQKVFRSLGKLEFEVSIIQPPRIYSAEELDGFSELEIKLCKQMQASSIVSDEDFAELLGKIAGLRARIERLPFHVSTLANQIIDEFPRLAALTQLATITDSLLEKSKAQKSKLQLQILETLNSLLAEQVEERKKALAASSYIQFTFPKLSLEIPKRACQAYLNALRWVKKLLKEFSSKFPRESITTTRFSTKEKKFRKKLHEDFHDEYLSPKLEEIKNLQIELIIMARSFYSYDDLIMFQCRIKAFFGNFTACLMSRMEEKDKIPNEYVEHVQKVMKVVKIVQAQIEREGQAPGWEVQAPGSIFCLSKVQALPNSVHSIKILTDSSGCLGFYDSEFLCRINEDGSIENFKASQGIICKDSEEMSCVLFLPRTLRFVYATTEHIYLKHYQNEQLVCVHTLAGFTWDNHITALCIGKDENEIIGITLDLILVVWHWQKDNTLKEISRKEIGNPKVDVVCWGIEYLPSQQRLIINDVGFGARLCRRTPADTFDQRFHSSEGHYKSTKYLPKSKLLMSFPMLDGCLNITQVSNSKRSKVDLGNAHLNVKSIAISPDEKIILAYCSSRQQLYYFEKQEDASFKLTYTEDASDYPSEIFGIAFMPNGQDAYICCEHHIVTKRLSFDLSQQQDPVPTNCPVQ